MKFFASVALFVPLLATLVAAEPAPQPQPGPSALQARQLSVAEFKARQEHPDLFQKRDLTSPSGGGNPCPDRRRRDLDDGEIQILTPEEAAAFLMGRGKLTSSNGTYYHDIHYATALDKETHRGKGYYHNLYNVVKDTLGNKLLEISIPHYKKWKNTLSKGDTFHLSPYTAIRVEDLEAIEDYLLADPEFTDVQVWNFRINRRFFEVSRLY